MDARLRRYAPQASPERTKVWTEPPPKHAPQQQQRQGRKVPVVYYLCRNRHLEHPHFIEVPLSSEGLYLKDVIDRLNVLRGRKMATMYSWSCKRSYKNGFVWHDLSEDDLILPVQGNEYVLKGSELLDQTPPDRNNHGITNVKIQNAKNPLQEPPTACCNGEEASCSLSSVAVVIKEAKVAPTLPTQPPPTPIVQEDDQSPPTRRSHSSGNLSPELDGRTTPPSGMSSPNPAEYKVCKPIEAQNASTQTDDRGRRISVSNIRIVGVSTDDRSLHTEYNESQNEQTICLKEEPEVIKIERSPPPTFSSASSSSCGKMNTLESLIRDEASKRKHIEVVEEEVLLPTGSKFKATNMLMHLITCGSISVKDHYGFGFVPSYKPGFTEMKLTPPTFANSVILGEINSLPECQREFGLRIKKKERISGGAIKTNKYKEKIGEGVPILTQSTSLNEHRNMPYSRRDEEVVDLAQSKCLPKTIDITSCKHFRSDQNETIPSLISDISNSPAWQDICKSSPCSSSNGGSRRITDSSSLKGSSRRLSSGARVIIESRTICDDSDDGSE
ncbi:hypothetical protein Cni_G22066 [Canna indica]|uniref:SOSEKI DIX-like domain-containing protein n=1 Tax=Canna indica TaxID=4628 RepID=A0AAQ3KTP3_9LILI|nr:hypothetical protein Cni_G22066 [Canna indica]